MIKKSLYSNWILCIGLLTLLSSMSISAQTVDCSNIKENSEKAIKDSDELMAQANRILEKAKDDLTHDLIDYKTYNKIIDEKWIPLLKESARILLESKVNLAYCLGRDL